MVVSILLAMAMVAALVSAVEAAALLRHLSQGPRKAEGYAPKVSVLKPLCGRDPSLEQNLASFLEQDYADYEVLLGVRNAQDPAYPVAQALAAAHPERVRLLLQEGEPGLNPKVNQLITLARHAQGQVLVISDSNVRVPRGYLTDLVAPLADARVGLVTSPISGEPGADLGGRLDALHLLTYITPAVVSTKLVARQDLTVGKSMALRRADVAELGGFEAFRRVLAEDYALGRATLKAGKRVELARLPIQNVTGGSVKTFFDRYARWGLMMRWVAGPGYPAQILTFPMLLATLALLAGLGNPEVHLFALAILAAKALCDALCIHALTGRWPSWRTLALSPVREAVVFGSFVRAMLNNKVSWRGNPFYVTRGTRMMSPAARERLLRLKHA